MPTGLSTSAASTACRNDCCSVCTARTSGRGARQALSDGSYGEAVRVDETQAARLGISGVPFCVVDGKHGVSGAQPGQTFAQALREAGGASGG
jgi:predicted DsbA family dithiol-disulfide isomerase